MFVHPNANKFYWQPGHGLRFARTLLMYAGLLLACGLASAADDAAEPNSKFDSLQPIIVRVQELERLQGIQKDAALKLRQPVLNQIEAACRDENAKVRAAAVNAYSIICYLREDRCPKVLIDCLVDEDATVRHSAATYVPILRHTEASITKLLTVAEHSDHRTRDAVVSTLIGWKRRTPRVVKALEKATHDPHFGVAHNAYVGLFKATQELKPLIRYAVAGIEEHALHIERENTDRLSEAELLASTHRELLVFSCAMIVNREAKEHPREVAEIIASMLDDPNPVVRRSAARNLGAISTANWKAKLAVQIMQADRLLEPLLDDPDESVRNAAAYGQSMIREPAPRDDDSFPQPAIAEKP